MSNGVSTSGVVTDRLIDKLMKGVDGFGKYEIVYDSLLICPVELVKSNSIVYSSNSATSLCIEFTLVEYRNYQLKKVLSN